MRKLLILPPIILGAAILAYQIASKKPPKQAPPSERSRHVRVIELSPVSVVPSVRGYGTVSPARTWSAVAQVSGKVVFLHPEFQKGEIMKAGTEIIRIAATDYVIALNQAEANIRASKAKLAELDVNAQNIRATLKIEERVLVIVIGERDRKKKLLRKGAVAQASIDQEERNVLVQQKKVQDLTNALRLVPSQREAQKEQIKVNEAQRETARLNLARTSIKLPFDARIAKADVEKTQFVGVGQKLGSADGMNRVEIDAQIPHSTFRNMTTVALDGRAPVGITKDTLPALVKKTGLNAIVGRQAGDRDTQWQGRVARISDMVDPKTRTIGVIVVVDDVYKKAIPGEKPPLFKGMFVPVELRVKPQAVALIVPRSALHDGSLYIINDKNRLEIRPVRISLRQQNFAVVAKGLKAGDRVVVSDLSPTITGMLLRVTVDTALSEQLKMEASGEPAQGPDGDNAADKIPGSSNQ